MKISGQLAKLPATHRETHQQYFERIRKAFMGIPKDFMNRVYRNWKRRVQACIAAKGGRFDESDI